MYVQRKRGRERILSMPSVEPNASLNLMTRRSWSELKSESNASQTEPSGHLWNIFENTKQIFEINLKAKVKHVDNNMYINFLPVSSYCFKDFLIFCPSICDLGIDWKDRNKRSLACDLTFWLMFIKMIKLNEIFFILLFSLFCFSVFMPLLDFSFFYLTLPRCLIHC